MKDIRAAIDEAVGKFGAAAAEQKAAMTGLAVLGVAALGVALVALAVAMRKG